jgi:hypothetical protein
MAQQPTVIAVIAMACTRLMGTWAAFVAATVPTNRLSKARQAREYAAGAGARTTWPARHAAASAAESHGRKQHGAKPASHHGGSSVCNTQGPPAFCSQRGHADEDRWLKAPVAARLALCIGPQTSPSRENRYSRQDLPRRITCMAPPALLANDPAVGFTNLV